MTTICSSNVNRSDQNVVMLEPVLGPMPVPIRKRRRSCLDGFEGNVVIQQPKCGSEGYQPEAKASIRGPHVNTRAAEKKKQSETTYEEEMWQWDSRMAGLVALNCNGKRRLSTDEKLDVCRIDSSKQKTLH